MRTKRHIAVRDPSPHEKSVSTVEVRLEGGGVRNAFKAIGDGPPAGGVRHFDSGLHSGRLVGGIGPFWWAGDALTEGHQLGDLTLVPSPYGRRVPCIGRKQLDAESVSGPKLPRRPGFVAGLTSLQRVTAVAHPRSLLQSQSGSGSLDLIAQEFHLLPGPLDQDVSGRHLPDSNLGGLFAAAAPLVAARTLSFRDWRVSCATLTPHTTATTPAKPTMELNISRPPRFFRPVGRFGGSNVSSGRVRRFSSMPPPPSRRVSSSMTGL